MSRMDAIRKQYQQSDSQRQAPERPSRRVSPVRPRGFVWKMFWLMVIVSMLGGFWAAKYKVVPMLKKFTGEPSTAQSVGPEPGTPQAATGAADAQIPVEKIKQFVSPGESEMNQLFEYVRNSSHVVENVLYSNIMAKVKFGYDIENNDVNAYATVSRVEKNSDTVVPVIVYLGGAARFGRIASLALAAEMAGDKGAAARFLSMLKPIDCGKLDMAAAQRIIGESGLGYALKDEQVISKAKSISAGLALGVIAHECGHHSLGHVLATKKSPNLEISRNQEREADSFASSIIASSPFSDYILTGTLLWYYALANQQGDAVATTHPLAKERFDNFVRANEKLAASLGIRL